MQDRGKLLAGLLALLFLGGCSEKPIPNDGLQGRWLSQKEDDFIEFTPSGLCVEVNKSPENVVARRYAVSGNMVTVTLLSSGELYTKTKSSKVAKTEKWTVSLDGQVLLVSRPRGSEKFRLAREGQGVSSLIGLWSYSRRDGRTDYCEFTPWGDSVTLIWYPIPTSKPNPDSSSPPFLFSEWHSYRFLGDVLRREGISPFDGRRLFSVRCEAMKDTLTFTKVDPKAPRQTLATPPLEPADITSKQFNRLEKLDL